MSKFLLALWDGGGMVPPELGLAHRLIARGHKVIVLGDPTIEDEALAAGCTFTPWTTAPHATSRAPEAQIIRDWEPQPFLKMIARYMHEFLGDPAPRWAADTTRAISEHAIEAFLGDWSIPAALIAARGAKIPTFSLVPNIWIIPTKGIPPMGPGLMPARTFAGDARDAFLRMMMRRVFDQALPPLNQTRATYALPALESTYANMLDADRVLVLSSPKFDFTSPFMPRHVRYTGPILDEPSWTEPWTSPWPASDTRPLVLAAFSSGFQDQAAHLARVSEALASLPIRAVVTLGRNIDPSDVPGSENVMVVRSAPHRPILEQASAAVIHCGHGTTMKALVAGVPLVCMPMGRDQNDTAARVVVRGAGVRIKVTSPVDRIRGAVERVLSDESLRAGARAMSRAITSGDGCVDAVDEILSVVNDGPAASSSRMTRQLATA
jgi:MGT family glycosyltransferase